LSKKSGKIAAMIESLQGQEYDAHYLGYFQCFNLGLYYEAHDVLEELWLPSRGMPLDGFYKGLIQFAGAFVHLQKNRLQPAAALFRLSRQYLGVYPSPLERLDLVDLLAMGSSWLSALEESHFRENPIHTRPKPQLLLMVELKRS
jgi:predicted metal-dependent hydrolase